MCTDGGICALSRAQWDRASHGVFPAPGNKRPVLAGAPVQSLKDSIFLAIFVLIVIVIIIIVIVLIFLLLELFVLLLLIARRL